MHLTCFERVKEIATSFCLIQSVSVVGMLLDLSLWYLSIWHTCFCLSICLYCVNLQVFSYTHNSALQADDLCIDVSALGGPVNLVHCHGIRGNQEWEYNREVDMSFLPTVCCVLCGCFLVCHVCFSITRGNVETGVECRWHMQFLSRNVL